MHDKKAKPRRETNPAAVRAAVMDRFDRRITTEGEVEFPCVPAMLDAYVAKLSALWKLLGKPFSEGQLAALKTALATELANGYRASPYSRLSVSYATDENPLSGIQYLIEPKVRTMEEIYEHSQSGREGARFGRLADAKVLAVAEALGDPASAPAIDIGAGDGRNAVPLARRGHRTLAVEPVTKMAAELERTAAAESLPLEVQRANVLSPEVDLGQGRFKLALLVELVSHLEHAEEVRQVVTKVAGTLAPGGLMVVNAFLALEGYKPDPIVRQASRVMWSTVFTRADFAFVTDELAFDRMSDESAYEYEKEHLPAEGWPPTPWFASWAQGGDVFALPPGKAPAELRWLVYRKR
jgi:hypothetical protein